MMSAAEKRESAAIATRARESLAPEDQAWLAARLEEYRELLSYLRDH